MAMASLNASLLAPKGGAYPSANAPSLAPASRNPYPILGRITQRETEGRKAPKAKGLADRKTKKKSLRLSASMDKDLRLLAVRNGLSQQALLELAVSDYLDRAFASSECMCKR